MSDLTKCQGCGEPSKLEELNLDLICDYCSSEDKLGE